MTFIKKYCLESLIFLLVAVAFLIKLDYYYFFTDEILYVQTGAEHLSGIYTDTLQVPPLPKLLAGGAYIVAGRNLFLLRLPYALMGIASTYFVYLILKREFSKYFALFGVVLFVTDRIIFDATRMVMLEPLMHLAWLGFLYFYYNTFHNTNKKSYIFCWHFCWSSLCNKSNIYSNSSISCFRIYL